MKYFSLMQECPILYFSNNHKAIQPTIAPAVPGAIGEYPEPRAVANSL